MSKAPNTGSTLDAGQVNKTSTSLSTHIIIKVNGKSVGAIKSISVQQSRTIKAVDELGTDGHIDMVPTSSTNVSGSCQRIRFDKMRIAQAFGRGFVHPQSQVYPFDIDMYDIQNYKPSNDIRGDFGGQTTIGATGLHTTSNGIIITTIKNVWIKSINTTYSADDWIISDSMDWDAETIYTSYDGGVFTPDKTARPDVWIKDARNPYVDSIESTTDTGKYRGSMDAGGIIDISSGLF
jgi:hypothetical protein